MNDRIESAAVQLDAVGALLTTITASLTSASGVPSNEALATALYGVQQLVGSAKSQLLNT